MKIMFCVNSVGIGGAERVISNLANTFVKNNEVSVVVSISKKDVYKLNDKVRYEVIVSKKIKSKLFRNIYRLFKTKKIIKDIKPDVIVVFLPEPSIRMGFLRKNMNVPLIISVRDDPKVDYKKLKLYLPMKLFFKNADGFVFQTEEQRSFFSEDIQKKSTIIFNPINSNFICEPFKGERRKVIVSAGRLMPQKNQKLLIDAFKIVHEKHPDYILNIFGEGPLREELQEQINSLGLTNNVFLKGISSNIKDEVYDASMFALSSVHEGLPNALLEAMALGTPCITTRFSGGGAETIINNKVNGLLVENDVKSLCDGINYYIDNKDKAIQYGLNASKDMSQYTEEAITNKWSDYINKVVSEFKKK